MYFNGQKNVCFQLYHPTQNEKMSYCHADPAGCNSLGQLLTPKLSA